MSHCADFLCSRSVVTTTYFRYYVASSQRKKLGGDIPTQKDTPQSALRAQRKKSNVPYSITSYSLSWALVRPV